VNKKFSLILFLSLALVMILAALLLVRRPIKAGDWNGAPLIETTTPTLTLPPAVGWWNDMPTLRVQPPTPADDSSPTICPIP